MSRRAGDSRRTYLGASTRKLLLPCPRCGARTGRRCTRTLNTGVVVRLVDTHDERKPKRPRKGADDE